MILAFADWMLCLATDAFLECSDDGACSGMNWILLMLRSWLKRGDEGAARARNDCTVFEAFGEHSISFGIQGEAYA